MMMMMMMMVILELLDNFDFYKIFFVESWWAFVWRVQTSSHRLWDDESFIFIFRWIDGEICGWGSFTWVVLSGCQLFFPETYRCFQGFEAGSHLKNCNKKRTVGRSSFLVDLFFLAFPHIQWVISRHPTEVNDSICWVFLLLSRGRSGWVHAQKTWILWRYMPWVPRAWHFFPFHGLMDACVASSPGMMPQAVLGKWLGSDEEEKYQICRCLPLLFPLIPTIFPGQK